MMKRVLLLAAAMSLAACTAAPYKQPLNSTTAGKLREAGVYSKIDDRGVGVQYFAQDSSATSAQYGLVGALVGVAVDAMMNAGPIGLAESGATKLAPAFNYDQTSGQFSESLQAQLGQVPLFGAVPPIQALDKERKWEANLFSEPAALLTSVEYSLTQDFRTLEIVLSVDAVAKDAVKLRTRKRKWYQPDEGRIYRNRFVYRSAPLEIYREKTQAEIDAEITQIRAKYQQAKANTRNKTALTDTALDGGMKKEISRARRKAPPDVKAEHYVGLWAANDAVLLRNELQAGVVAVAELLARDLQDIAPVDKATSSTKTTLVTGDQRIISRINNPPFKGSLISESTVSYAVPGSNGTAYPRKKKPDDAAAPEAAPAPTSTPSPSPSPSPSAGQ